MRSRAPGIGVAAVWLALALAMLPVPAVLAHDSAEEEVASLSRAIAREPSNVDLRVLRAEFWRIEGDWTEAQEDLDRAESLEPGRIDVRLSRAALLHDQGKHEPALALLATIRGSGTHSMTAHELRAKSLIALERTDEAVTELDTLVALGGPSAPDHYVTRARLLTADRRLTEALSGIDRGIASLGHVPILLELGIELETQLGRFDRALERLDVMRASLGGGVAMAARRARLLDAAGRAMEAEASWTEALREIEKASPARRLRLAALERDIRAALAGRARGASR